MKIELFNRWFAFYYFNGTVCAKGVSIYFGKKNYRFNF